MAWTTGTERDTELECFSVYMKVSARQGLKHKPPVITAPPRPAKPQLSSMYVAGPQRIASDCPKPWEKPIVPGMFQSDGKLIMDSWHGMQISISVLVNKTVPECLTKLHCKGLSDVFYGAGKLLDEKRRLIKLHATNLALLLRKDGVNLNDCSWK